MAISVLLGYLPWYNFSAVLKYLTLDFNLTPRDSGFIIAAFQAGYVIIVPFAGWIGDRFGLKKTILWATFLTAVFSTLFVWTATGKWSILIFRLITGLSAGAIYAPGMALLSHWFPPSERGKALGTYTGAAMIAYAGAYFIAAPLAAKYGWQTGILWTSLPVFIAVLIIWVFVEEKPDVKPQEDGETRLVSCETSKNTEILPAPQGGYWGPVLLTVSYMGHMWELYAFMGWVGPFMVAVAIGSGMEMADAVATGGVIAATIILLGAPASAIWGIIADKWGRTKSIILVATFSTLGQLFFGYLYSYSLTLVVIVGLWIGFWVVADTAIYKAGLTDMVSTNIRATLLGFQSAAGFLMTVIAPVVFGWVLEYYNGPIDSTSATVWGPPFLMLGLGATISPLASLLLRRLPQAKLMGGGKL